MIRNATHADIPAMLAMGREFADDAGVTEWIEWDEASVEEMLRFLIDDERGILLVSDGGMFGGFVYPHEFNQSVLVFKECFWRSQGIEGVKMLKQAERLAKDMGAGLSAMFTPIKMKPEAVGRLYERIGYAPGERIYLRKL